MWSRFFAARLKPDIRFAKTAKRLSVSIRNASAQEVFVRVDYGSVIDLSFLSLRTSLQLFRKQMSGLMTHNTSPTTYSVPPGASINIQPSEDHNNLPASAIVVNARLLFARHPDDLRSMTRHPVAAGRVSLVGGRHNHVLLREVPLRASFGRGASSKLVAVLEQDVPMPTAEKKNTALSSPISRVKALFAAARSTNFARIKALAAGAKARFKVIADATRVKALATVNTTTKAITAASAVGTFQYRILDQIRYWAMQSPTASKVRVDNSDPASHPEITVTAHVRSYKDTKLCAQEQEYIKRRKAVALLAFAKLFEIDTAAIHPADVPTIAFAASGGGYRSMLATIGSIMGAHQSGILSCSTFFAGLSGSTWSLVQWLAMEHRNDISLLCKTAYSRVSKDFFAVNAKTIDAIMHSFLQKAASQQDFSIVDVFGVLLGLRLLPHVMSSRSFSHPKLSYLGDAAMAHADMPLPIFTVVYDDAKHLHQWFEMTPFEAGSPALGAFVPMWALGRRFENGVSIDNPPELSLTSLLGMTGSAFCATVGQVWKNLLSKVQPVSVRRALASLVHTELRYLKNRPFRAAFTANPTYKMDLTQYPMAAQPTLNLMDAGLDYNLPFQPLLRPERQVDVIITLDNSSHLVNAPHLMHALQHARSTYPTRDFPQFDPTHLARQIVTVAHSPSLSVVYLPLIANPQQGAFNPRQHLGPFGHLRTANFKYSEKQAIQLTELSCANMNHAAKTIKQELWRVYQQNKARREGQAL